MKVQTLPLRQALKLVSSVVAKNPFIPILEGVKLEPGFITASNNELSMRVPTIGTLPECVLQYAVLSAAVNQLQDDEIDLTLSDVAGIVKSGRTKISVPVLGNVADFPRMGTDVNAPGCTLSRADVEHVAAMVAFASTDQLRPAMTGIYFDGENFVATDGSIMANYKTEAKKTAPAILPARLFTLLNSFQKATDFVFEAGAVTVKRDADTLAEIRFRCIDERYPEWQNVVPPIDNHARAYFEREEMVDAIDVLNIGVSKETSSAAFTFGVGGGVTAEAQDLLLNKEASTGIAADVTNLAKSVKMGFNTGLLAKALKLIGGEMVSAYFSEPNRAAIFKSKEFNGFALVMPVQVA